MNALLRFVTHPARLVPLAFLAAIIVGTVLLSLPIATAGPTRPPVLTAAFTSVSAVCVTGLVTVDTATYWSLFGQVVILGLIQVGGFGIMTLATLLAMLVGGRLGLRSSLVAQAETHTLNLGDTRHVLRRVAITMLSFEAVIAVALKEHGRSPPSGGPTRRAVRRGACRRRRPTRPERSGALRRSRSAGGAASRRVHR